MLIAVVAGEPSGDHLGASLIRALKQRDPSLCFIGIGGEHMKAQGLYSFFELDRLSIMGLIEPFCRLPELVRMVRFLLDYFKKRRPDLYIGIDAPDFNLRIAQVLKARGVKTLHYVSPTIWAWRAYRIHWIKKALDHILLIFPFEQKIYRQYALDYDYVGHPLADEIAEVLEKKPARQHLNITAKKIIAILPGSRTSEIQNITQDFIKTAESLHQQDPELYFVAALLDNKKADLFQKLLNKYQSKVPIHIIINQTRTVLQACDAAMVVSGTATLETALMKRPFIVAYRTGYWQYNLARHLIHVKYIAMPNLIANHLLVQEYIQDKINPEKMAKSLMNLLKNSQDLIKSFEDMHRLLKHNASEKAADAVIRLLYDKKPEISVGL